MQDEILTVSKVAEILEISQEEVKQLSEDKLLIGYKLGQNTYYLYSDLVYRITGKNPRIKVDCYDSEDRREELDFKNLFS